MKTISITIDESLLRAIDRATKATRRTRSDVFRAALRDWLARARWREMARRDREAYTSVPVTPEEFDDLIAAQPWLEGERKRSR